MGTAATTTVRMASQAARHPESKFTMTSRDPTGVEGVDATIGVLEQRLQEQTTRTREAERSYSATYSPSLASSTSNSPQPSSPTPASTAARLRESSHMYSPSSPGEQAAVLRWCPSAGIANARSQLSASPPAARSISLSVSPQPVNRSLQDPRLLSTSDSDCQRLGSIVKASDSVEDLLAAVAVQAQHENAYAQATLSEKWGMGDTTSRSAGRATVRSPQEAQRDYETAAFEKELRRIASMPVGPGRDMALRLLEQLKDDADSVNEQKRIEALPRPDRKIAEAAAKAAMRPELSHGYLGMSRPHVERGSHSELERRLGPAQGHSKLGSRLLARPRLGFVPGEQAYSHQDKPHRSPICEQGPVVRRVTNVMTDYFEDEAQAFAKDDMKRFDVNEDGVLDREEFTQMQTERQNCRTTDFDRFDWNQSGSMDEVELAAMHVKMALKKVSFGSR